jgi:hypothetical protein
MVAGMAYVDCRRESVKFEKSGNRFVANALKSETVVICCGTKPGPSSALF